MTESNEGAAEIDFTSSVLHTKRNASMVVEGYSKRGKKIQQDAKDDL
jgi:hypothetical protein